MGESDNGLNEDGLFAGVLKNLSQDSINEIVSIHVMEKLSCITLIPFLRNLQSQFSQPLLLYKVSLNFTNLMFRFC